MKPASGRIQSKLTTTSHPHTTFLGFSTGARWLAGWKAAHKVAAMLLLRRVLPSLRRRLPPASTTPPLSAPAGSSRFLRSGPSGLRRRPPPLAPLGAAAATAEEGVQQDDAAPADGDRMNAADTRRARWEALQRRAFEADGGEEGEDEDEEEEAEWEVDLRGQRRRGEEKKRVRNAPDELPQVRRRV